MTNADGKSHSDECRMSWFVSDVTDMMLTLSIKDYIKLKKHLKKSTLVSWD